MTKPSFADWIMTQPVTDDPRGDFVADTRAVIAGGTFPAVSRWRELVAFMTMRRAALVEARKVWRAYEAMASATA